MLTANPHLTAIYSACGPPALGAIQSITTAGIKPGAIILVGFDGLPDEIKAVKAGTESATVQQHALCRHSGQEGAQEHRHRHRHRDRHRIVPPDGRHFSL